MSTESLWFQTLTLEWPLAGIAGIRGIGGSCHSDCLLACSFGRGTDRELRHPTELALDSPFTFEVSRWRERLGGPLSSYEISSLFWNSWSVDSSRLFISLLIMEALLAEVKSMEEIDSSLIPHEAYDDY